MMMTMMRDDDIDDVHVQVNDDDDDDNIIDKQLLFLGLCIRVFNFGIKVLSCLLYVIRVLLETVELDGARGW